MIFRKEIYASACLVGGTVYLGLNHFTDNRPLNMMGAMLVVMIIRYLAVRNHWPLQFEAKG